MPMKVFKMSLLLSVVLFSYTFSFYFSLPFLSSVFFFLAPLPRVPNTLLDFPTHHTSESSNSGYYHLLPFITLIFYKAAV